MIENVLFGIVGIFAVFAAAMMLGSKNAVHSALWLIVNFICVAVLYLILEASFLAMVQIAVYAGAIMVLFLFVIMLLGAERLPVGESVRTYPWVGGAALALVLSLVIMLSLVILFAGQAETTPEPVNATAQLRLLNAAIEGTEETETVAMEGEATQPVVTHVDLYVNGELFADDIEAGHATDFTEVPAGDHTIAIHAAGDATPLLTSAISLAPQSSLTVIVRPTADHALVVDTLNDDFTPVQRRNGRVTVYNAFPGVGAISIVRVNSILFDDSRNLDILVSNLAQGDSASVEIPEGRYEWRVIEAGREEEYRNTLAEDALLYRLPDIEIERGVSKLQVLAAETDAVSGQVRADLIDGGNLVGDAAPNFGTPESVGGLLFIDYLLPLQLVALLLLAAMVGVIVLTHREDSQPKPSRATRRKVSRPLTSVIAAQTGTDVSTNAPQLPQPTQDPVGD
ncbi:MAG: NADH-quinone oxidoreductase subunit J [Anaerolineae bacterium]|jgi:NADH-quinone oxidoreductase subunit J|nr:NADH-quinone oxidoreductase subunit J [Anaerolineae bacterium]